MSLPGNPLNFVRRAADGSIEEPRVHVDVIRQNTEGLYAGVEWTRVPREVRDALTTHPRFAPFVDVQDDDLAATVRLVTRSATRRVLRFAFERAVQRGATTVTLCDKPNVLRATGGLFEEEARRAASEFPDVRLRTVNIDAQMMWLTRSPEDEEVVVAGNMFGDIVSDAFAGLVGGLGFACSANLGRDVALFEPTHGSAPRYAALDPPIVNPSAAILAGAMLLDHVGESAKASQVRSAVRRVVAEGRVRTYDMCRLQGGPQVLGQGAVSTGRFADAVIEALQHS